VLEKLSKVANCIPFKSTHKASDIVNVFMKGIFRLHKFPKDIISDRDAKFASNF
jgi:hypothetical protein